MHCCLFCPSVILISALLFFLHSSLPLSDILTKLLVSPESCLIGVPLSACLSLHGSQSFPSVCPHKQGQVSFSVRPFLGSHSRTVGFNPPFLLTLFVFCFCFFFSSSILSSLRDVFQSHSLLMVSSFTLSSLSALPS